MFCRSVLPTGVARLASWISAACLLLLWLPALAHPALADPQEPSSKPETAGKKKTDEGGETPEEGTAKASSKAKTKAKTKDSAKDSKKSPAKKSGKAEGSKPAEPAEDKEPGKEAEGAKTITPDPDTAFVKENLERFLFPTSSKFLDDGRVTLQFDFGEKKEEHGDIFNIPVGKKLAQPFRWTIREEEFVVGGEAGLRISNAGIALLKAWFKDEVEAEMEFLQHVNHEPRHVSTLIFANGKGAAIGSNYGGQCAMISSGRISKTRGKTIPVSFNSTGKIKLVVKGGTFEAHRDGRQRATSKYSPKTYSSGQIGFYWGGSLSGTITKLTITGRLDIAKMAAAIRKEIKS